MSEMALFGRKKERQARDDRVQRQRVDRATRRRQKRAQKAPGGGQGPAANRLFTEKAKRGILGCI